MAGAVYVDQAALEAEFGSSQVRTIFCDDGSTVNATRLLRCCTIASREADAELLKGWRTLDTIETLVEEDAAVLSAICKLTMAAGANAKPEWSGPNSPYAAFRSEALGTLRAVAKADKRSAGETVAGANPHVTGSVSSPQTPAFIFAPSRGRPHSSGY